MGFAEAWRNIQKPENVHPDELQKLQEPHFDSNGSDPKRHISEKQAPVDPVPKSDLPPDDWYDSMIDMAIDDLAGVQLMTYPEHLRDKARALADEFSEAAVDGDEARFWRALRDWQETWKGGLH